MYMIPADVAQFLTMTGKILDAYDENLFGEITVAALGTDGDPQDPMTVATWHKGYRAVPVAQYASDDEIGLDWVFDHPINITGLEMTDGVELSGAEMLALSRICEAVEAVRFDRFYDVRVSVLAGGREYWVYNTEDGTGMSVLHLGDRYPQF